MESGVFYPAWRRRYHRQALELGQVYLETVGQDQRVDCGYFLLIEVIAAIVGAMGSVQLRIDKISGQVYLEIVWQNQGLIVDALCWRKPL